MTIQELGSILGEAYRTAPEGSAVTAIHLFGIKYAEEITATGVSMKDLAICAGIGESYGTEIGKGVRLAKHVSIR